MRDTEDTTSYGSLTVEEAFALVGNEVRQQILLALSDPGSETLDTPVLSFSEVYDRIDAAVNTSQFNYHLQQLLGHFVESRAEGTGHLNEAIGEGEGYALRPEGLLLVWTIRSGTATGDPDLDPFDAGFDCHHCGTAVRAAYENAIFNVGCPGCGYHYEYNLTPPGVVHRASDPDEVLERVARYNRTMRGGFARGACPLCASDVDARFVDAAATNYPRADLREAFVHCTCDHCGFIDYLTVGEYLVADAELVAFCLDHGTDVTRGPLWELPFVTTDEAVTVDGRDPWAVTFELTRDGETLAVELDASLTRTVTARE